MPSKTSAIVLAVAILTLTGCGADKAPKRPLAARGTLQGELEYLGYRQNVKAELAGHYGDWIPPSDWSAAKAHAIQERVGRALEQETPHNGTLAPVIVHGHIHVDGQVLAVSTLP